MDEAMLKARKDALDELVERLSYDEYDVAERAIDLFMDILEDYRN